MSVLLASFSTTKRFITTFIHLIKPIATTGLFIMTISSCGSGGSDQQEDPLVAQEPVAYVKRPVPVDDNDVVETEEILEPVTFNGGAGLYIRDRASTSATERNVTDSAFSAGAVYDVKDVEVSYDAEKLLFSMRAPQLENVDEEDQPKWNLWEYDLSSDTLSQVIADPIRSGEHHDISPAYLPDGRIVFTSTRQVRSRAILLDEGKSGYAATTDDEDIFNLHIVDPINDPNGSNIQQITFSQGHDLQPTTLSDGRIAFLRSEIAEQRDKLSIYTINSDGSNLRLLYGYHSQETGNTSNNETTFIDVRELSDGSLSAILQARESDTLGGDIIRIDHNGFIDLNQPTDDNSGDTNPGQNSLTQGTVNLDTDISTHGYFNSAYPVNSNGLRFLVSWNPCRLRDPVADTILACSPTNLANTALEQAPPFFGLWLYDAGGGTQTPVAIAQEGEMFTDVVLMKERTIPSEVASAEIDNDLAGRGVGILHIRSVYDTDGNDTSTAGISVLRDPTLTLASARPARFLRIIKPVSIPSDDVYDFDNSAFGLSQARGMREILGYTPIEPDGSVRVEVPSDVAFYFDVVDVNGERTSPLHRNYLQLKGGETYECNGCHTANSELPHGRLDAEAPSANPGAFEIGVHFPNTQYSNIPNVEYRETMAEVYSKAPDAMNPNGARSISTGLVYTDDWSNPAVNADYNLLYAGDANFTGLITPAPASAGCQTTWQSNCRTVINYIDHIQPLWEATRAGGACTSCHSASDSMSNPQQPAGQLELTNQPSAAEATHYTSYRELLQQDTPLIIHPDGNSFLNLYVIDNVNGTAGFADTGGNPILARLFVPGTDNAANILIQSFTGVTPDTVIVGSDTLNVLTPINPTDIPNTPVMQLSNSAGSSFFDKLEGTAGTVDHSSFMSPNELRLLREWLDIGGQYYNNPLDAPLD